MAVISKPGTYDPAKGSVAGYLFGIARNLIRHRMRESANHVPFVEDGIEEDAACTDDDIDLLEQLSQSQSFEYLRKAVVSLPEMYREVVVLCELEEMSYPEAAAILKCSPGTIASRLNRAKAMLRTKLRGQGCMR